ncbi:gamma-glutamyltranspeptidase [Catenuloplanes nepalensis]|uniref:Gamma-glutamyltranspeptidase n=1 Tax=Catenuloplanes nepalensis TaxID=587533 RepID=A0ABT9MLC9_9ACTN|nr:gamma-glutamyltransferase [Catenuloplanes nepalensis]MDP9792208.1 gamma-glutamyltranspeptidase [Catenuloplanes nepalensis]
MSTADPAPDSPGSPAAAGTPNDPGLPADAGSLAAGFGARTGTADAGTRAAGFGARTGTAPRATAAGTTIGTGAQAAGIGMGAGGGPGGTAAAAGRGVAVAAPHPAAIDAARAVVAAGGNAFDAALAAAAALTVAYPHQCSVGGDLVAIVRPAGGEAQAVLSIGAAAANVDVDALRAGGERMPFGGPLTVTVPGVVAGWAAIAGLGASLPLTALLEPAIRLAGDGVPVSPGLHRATLGRLDGVKADPGLSALLLDPATGEPVRTLVQPALAETLRQIGANWRAFYKGHLAHRLADGLAALGSPLTADDLAAHRAEVTTPLTTTVGDVTWSAAPPPVQGATFLAIAGATTSGATAPSAMAPGAAAPSAMAPGAAAPSAMAPNAMAPDPTASSAAASGATAPSTAPSDATAPSAAAPDPTASSAAASGATAPSAAPSDATAPSATASGATAPGAAASGAADTGGTGAAGVGGPVADVTADAADPPADAVEARAAALLTDARRAQLARDALLGDPRTGPIDLDGLLLRTTDAFPGADGGPKPAGDTVAVTAVDAAGNAVTLIQSVFQSFGSGLLEPGTGLVLHNRGSSFSLDPAHPARIAPGVRPPHTLCPTLATTPEGGVAALGCQGGRSQAWILAQVAPSVLDATDLDGLLARPRWIIGAREIGREVPTLLLEPGTPGVSALTRTAKGLDLAVDTTAGPHDDAGHIQIARRTGGVLAAASDPRADGLAAVL